jgi:hypothetical protein
MLLITTNTSTQESPKSELQFESYEGLKLAGKYDLIKARTRL